LLSISAFRIQKNVACFHTFKHIENSQDHWTTFTYIIGSETVEMEAAVCATGHKIF
jgi:hypothetical protein